MSDTNAGKNQIGRDAQASLSGWLEQAKAGGYIKEFFKNHRDGFANSDEKQFYAPFLIEFKNGERWILYSTTSLRDRVKANYWDAENLKKIDSRIVKAFLVYPDNRPIKEQKAFLSLSQRIKQKNVICPIDKVVPLSLFKAIIVLIGTEGKSSGFIRNAEGRAFEARVANALKNKANLRVLKGNTEDSLTEDMSLLEMVFEKLGIDPKTVSSVSSTSNREDIGLLPSGGLPKTDVLANVYYDFGEKNTLTISCKNSGSRIVTVGQHKADDIVFAVDPCNKRLRELLNKFQTEGAKSALSPSEQNELTNELSPIKREFCRFIIGGINGLGDPNKQWAKYVIVSHGDDLDNCAFYTLDEFIDELLSKPCKSFGTPFSWTYASDSKGKDIQFKVSISN